MMKTIYITTIFLFIAYLSFSQFQVEVDYPARNVKRFLLQDATEKYAYFDETTSEIKISNGEHELIESIPISPCNGFLNYYLLRNDFTNLDLGIFTYCVDQGAVSEANLIDGDGNKALDFFSIPDVDNRYIIDFDDGNFQTNIYSTQSLELQTLPQIKLVSTQAELWNENLYVGHNGIDSIFIYDEFLNEVHGLAHDFVSIDNNIKLRPISVDEDGVEVFYFLVSEGDTFGQVYEWLIDEDGGLVKVFDDKYPFPHKEGDLFQLIYSTSNGTQYSRFVVSEEQSDLLFNNFTGGTIYFQSSGEFLCFLHESNSDMVELYSIYGFVDREIELENPSSFLSLNLFEDHLGNKYYEYNQQSELDPSQNNAVIFKNWEYLQTIEGSSGVRVSNIEGFPTKLMSNYTNETNFAEIFRMETVSTNDLYDLDVNLFPSPVYDELSISSEVQFESYAIYSFDGKALQSDNINASDFSININMLQPGIYFISLFQESGNPISKKIIKI